MKRSRYARNIAPIHRPSYPVYPSDLGAAEDGWISEHPWMTFFIVLGGLSTLSFVVATVVMTSAVSSASQQLNTPQQ